MSLVSYVKALGSTNTDIKQAIEKSLDLVEYSFEKEIRNVVIKPNLCYYWDYSTGQTTDPNFVAELIDVIRHKVSHNVNVSVIESDASAMKCKYAFKVLGYEKMANHHDVTLVNLSEENTREVNVRVEDQSFSFNVPLIIQNADLRINVPKIKYMIKTKISCALKNIFGCNPYPNKFKYHKMLDETIVALNKIMKFDLCILDGIIVFGSQPCKLGLVMASQDPVALDVAAARIAGVNPSSVRHIMLANQEGIGNNALIPRGANPNSFKRKYPKKRPIEKLTYSAYMLLTKLNLLSTEPT
jgi:uncharacterized protein (DUF362 family)